MELLRRLTCLFVVTTLAAGGAAAATKPKVKPVCNLIKDAAGDASLQAPLPNDDGMDIVGADLASNTKLVTAVLRMKSVGNGSLSSVTGRRLTLEWTVPSGDYPLYLSMSTSQLGTYFDYGYLDTSATPPNIESQGAAQGTIIAAKNEIHITAPLSAFKPFGKVSPGSKFTEITASGAQVFGVPQNDSGVYTYVSGSLDDATAAKAYVAGTPSCVVPGK